MALINCPECGKEISDKSEKCIHCGYPIRSIPYLHENINGKDYDISFLLDNSMSQVKKMKQLTELSGCDLLLAKQIVLKYCPTKAVEQKQESNVPRCPICNSTNIKKISSLSKARSIAMWGFFSRKVHKQWHCNNCSSDF